MADFPSTHTFTGDGSTRIFPVSSEIKGNNYVRIEINDTPFLDTTKFDIINNSIVFATDSIPALNDAITIKVAESVEAIGNLGITTNTDLVAESINDVNTVADNITSVTTTATNIADINTVATNIAKIIIDADNIADINTVADNIAQLITHANTVYLDDAQTLTNKTIADLSNTVMADALHIGAKATEAISKGQAARITGYNLGTGDLEVALADQSLGQVATGIMAEDVTVGQVGMLHFTGVITDMDTSSWNEGDILYVNGGGTLTNVEPTTGIKQPIAYVLRKNANNGAIQLNATYPKQDADDVAYDASNTVKDVLDTKYDSTDLNVTVQAYDADTAKTDVTQTYTAPQRGTVTVANDGVFNQATSNKYSCTPTGAVTLTFNNMANGQGGTIKLDNSSGQIITAHANTKVDANFLTTISTAGIYYLGYESTDTEVYVWNSGALS